MRTRKRARKPQETVASESADSRKVCLYCGSSRVHKEAFGIYSSKNDEDDIVAKGFDSINHNNLVRKFVPMPQAMKNFGCESCSGQKNGKSSRRCQHGNWIR